MFGILIPLWESWMFNAHPHEWRSTKSVAVPASRKTRETFHDIPVGKEPKKSVSKFKNPLKKIPTKIYSKYYYIIGKTWFSMSNPV